jgi:hypothetical protein
MAHNRNTFFIMLAAGERPVGEKLVGISAEGSSPLVSWCTTRHAQEPTHLQHEDTVVVGGRQPNESRDHYVKISLW